jgi:peptidyl-prolyl cis-trans isomerase C
MNKRNLLLIALFGLLGSQSAYSEDEGVIAIINGKELTQEQHSLYASNRQAKGAPVPNEMITQELINRELIIQDAMKRELDKSPKFQSVMSDQMANLLAAFTINDHIASADINEESVKKEYDNYVSTLSDMEFLASHILLNDEESAKAVITELDQGRNFAELAMEKSTGPSGPEGGSLGWFRADQMVESFSAALQEMEKGTYSKEPVKTQFGWHVILLEDTRKLPPPSFENMQEQIRNSMVNKRIQGYIEHLRATANIELVE